MTRMQWLPDQLMGTESSTSVMQRDHLPISFDTCAALLLAKTVRGSKPSANRRTQNGLTKGSFVVE